MAAEDNLKFLVNWLEEFPMFKDSDLFLTGESYAGNKLRFVLFSETQFRKSASKNGEVNFILSKYMMSYLSLPCAVLRV